MVIWIASKDTGMEIMRYLRYIVKLGNAVEAFDWGDLFVLFCFVLVALVWGGLVGLLGPPNTNRENMGQISVDRRTSLLSHVQYPVSSKSSTKDLRFECP